jgi:hypothetical protein
MASIIKIFIFGIISFGAYWFFAIASPEQKEQTTEMAKDMKEDLGIATKKAYETVSTKGKELYENREEIMDRAKEMGASVGEKVKDTVGKASESLSE